ncbi:unnamed protein product [marine sediment metagenome]|uniref:Uncharacterized protein n=1 Tax=marine sediment metagenome TaxID=412755 RepID=X1CVT2_9ZZZZ
MVKEYKVGDAAILNVTWLKQTGEEATVTGTPTITIKKYDHVGNSWSTEVNAANMTNDAGSTWYYEWDTSGETADYDYKVFYNAVVDTLNVEATEDLRITQTFANTSDIQALREGNTRLDFTIATVAVAARGVEIGMVDTMTVMSKLDADSDWSSPQTSQTLYLWYDSDGKCTSRKESN